MREILFRGKDKDGNWVEGDLVYGINGICITCLEDTPPTQDDPCGCSIRMYYEVRHETVGQFTGITDKNGVKIFEGDIVEHDDYSDGACFGFKQKTSTDVVNIEHLMRGCTSLQGLPSHTIETAEITIVGNIFDNPELLNQK